MQFAIIFSISKKINTVSIPAWTRSIKTTILSRTSTSFAAKISFRIDDLLSTFSGESRASVTRSAKTLKQTISIHIVINLVSNSDINLLINGFFAFDQLFIRFCGKVFPPRKTVHSLMRYFEKIFRRKH